eukprot:1339039-Rhodomonas_salina.2
MLSVLSCVADACWSQVVLIGPVLQHAAAHNRLDVRPPFLLPLASHPSSLNRPLPPISLCSFWLPCGFQQRVFRFSALACRPLAYAASFLPYSLSVWNATASVFWFASATTDPVGGRQGYMRVVLFVLCTWGL